MATRFRAGFAYASRNVGASYRRIESWEHSLPREFCAQWPTTCLLIGRAFGASPMSFVIGADDRVCASRCLALLGSIALVALVASPLEAF